MSTVTVALNPSSPKLLSRRGVGKAAWNRVIENLIFSEKEDLKDLARLRAKFSLDAEAQRIIAEMQERKTIRIIELNDLLHYDDKKTRTRD